MCVVLSLSFCEPRAWLFSLLHTCKHDFIYTGLTEKNYVFSMAFKYGSSQNFFCKSQPHSRHIKVFQIWISTGDLEFESRK